MKGLIFALVLLFPTSLVAAPGGALPYKKVYIRTAHAYWGIDAPTANLAAQIETESNWNPHAKSWAGAEGLAQFMPTTAKWWSKKAGLDAPMPTNPLWAMRAQVSYMRWLYGRAQGHSPGDRLVLAQKSYNGGETWTRRDQKKALAIGLDPHNWRHVNRVNSGRKKNAWRENHNYPLRIGERAKNYFDWGPLWDL